MLVIDLRRLIFVLGSCIVLPLLIGFTLDRVITTGYFMVLVAALVSIPLASVIVCRAILAEMERISALAAAAEDERRSNVDRAV